MAASNITANATERLKVSISIVALVRIWVISRMLSALNGHQLARICGK